MEEVKSMTDVEQDIINEDLNEKEADSMPEQEVVEESDPSKSEPKEVDKAGEYLDRLQRLMAEFDNYRKRSQKEKTDAYDYAVGNTVTELLPIIDNFERALKVESEDKTFYEGVTMIYKQFTGLLEHLNVVPIDAKDKVFDPNLHNAILHIEDEAYEENVVVEELQKGYLYKEKVIRHSMVKVAN
jgi:molecular chaperone GrpE